jgi:oxalate decarboxylase/phosphoglucose isomerase-like protein (cupin superfamily)
MTERNFVYPEDVDRFAFDWGHLTLTIGPKVNGAQKFSAGVVHVPPGQGHSRHNHPGAEEIIYVLDGVGEQMVETPDGTPVTQQVRKGCTIFVPESRFHSTLNTGAEPMSLFVVYSPTGPEEFLRTLPDFRLVPPGAPS